MKQDCHVYDAKERKIIQLDKHASKIKKTKFFFFFNKNQTNIRILIIYSVVYSAADKICLWHASLPLVHMLHQNTQMQN